MTFKVKNICVDLELDNIVRAIEKAIGEDIPNQLYENRLETNNYIGLMRGDFINENLRRFLPSNGYELVPIQRYGWHGRVIINREKKVSISILTQANLRMIPQKKRSKPHYTMSILKVQNNDLQGCYKQQSLFPLEPFDEEILKADYDEIFSGAFDSSDGYHHFFITYRAEASELVDVRLVLMDPEFNIVEEVSLNHLIKPDFARLTEEKEFNIPTKEIHSEATRQLFRIKPGLRIMKEQA